VWRRLAWTSLFALLLIVACGPTTVTDINGGVSDDDDDVGTGDDDDDDAATTFPTGTTPPGGAPTLTNVPSFATWNASIRPLAPAGGCGVNSCHGGSGGVYFDDTPDDASQAKYYWFTAICNRTSNGDGAGMQAYSPPTGRFREYMIGNDPMHPGNIGTANAATVNNWFAQGGATVVPNCLDYYDLANSN
jgi:hypothetical protein